MTVVVEEQPTSDLRREVRPVNYVSPRSRWPGVLFLAVLVAGVTALAVSSYYDRPSPGEKIDALVVSPPAASPSR